MPRTGKIEKKQIAADPIYNNQNVSKLINKIMKHGKKSIAEKIVYATLENIKAKGKDPIQTFEKALEMVTPKMEVRPRRVGGASYMVPLEVRGARRQSLALSWLITSARSRGVKEFENRPKNKPIMIEKLTLEILQAADGAGNAFAKKEEMSRMAEANKAFAHFRW